MSMLKIDRLVVGVMQENCYILSLDGDESRDCIVVDPGDEAERIWEYCEDRGLRPSAVLLTHGHFDHIMALPGLKERYPKLRIYASKEELTLLASGDLNLSCYHEGHAIEIKDAEGLSDRESLSLLGHEFRLLLTPGHTGGSCCYYAEDCGVLLSGDTLFHLSYGRTDLPTSDGLKMPGSLERLFKLPEDTVVYPGHGRATTIGFERLHNPINME